MVKMTTLSLKFSKEQLSSRKPFMPIYLQLSVLTKITLTTDFLNRCLFLKFKTSYSLALLEL